MKKITIMSLHLGIGGIEKYISNFTKMLEEDFEIELIITYKLKENPSFPISNKIKIKYLINEGPNKEEVKKYIHRHKPLSLIKELLKSCRIYYLKSTKTRKALKNLKTDYLITTRLYETKLANKILKNKNIIKICTEHNDLSKKYRNKIIKATTNFNKLVVVNKTLERLYREKIGTKVISIPNFIDELSTKKAKLKNKNLIAVGRLSKEKGFLELIEVMDLLIKKDKSITLTLIGDGEEKQAIIDKVKELKLEDNIKLTGYLNSYEIEQEMLNSSLYVMISKTESFGMVLLDSMNVGVPVISYNDLNGPKEILNEVGLLVQRDKELLVSKIIELLNNNKELKELSKKSILKVKEYTIDNVKKEWLELLKSLEDASNKRVLFISSTGGHLNEMLKLNSMFNKYNYKIITENTPTNKGLKNKYGSKNVRYLIYGTRKHILVYPFKLLINTIKSFYYYTKFRPKYIITTGAHTAGPMCVIGKIFGSKIIYIESFANTETKTVTGRIVYHFADLFIVQWESMLELYENATYGGWIY